MFRSPPTVSFNAILYETNTNFSDFSIKGLLNNTTYYWRVNSEFGDESSPWSEVWSFEITDPYITLVSPNGGERIELGQTEIIRWETNVLEAVRIELLQDQNKIADLDTLMGSLQAYTWELEPSSDAGDNFRIRIVSESDNGIFGVSSNDFAITYPTGIGVSEEEISSGNSLAQNFPNPFSTATSISYTIQHPGRVSLKIYNLLGEEVRTLINETQEPGTYTSIFKAHGLSGGIYFYELRAGSEFVETKKMILY